MDFEQEYSDAMDEIDKLVNDMAYIVYWGLRESEMSIYGPFNTYHSAEEWINKANKKVNDLMGRETVWQIKLVFPPDTV